MWSDNETTRDYLGYQIHADVVRDLVTDSSLSPLTVGLFSDWGGGKSSIIRMLRRDLDPNDGQTRASSDERESYKKFACIYFNGWQLEGYDDARAALLSSILGELGKLERFGPKLREGVKELLKSVNWMRLVRGITSAGAAYLMGPGGALAAPAVTGLLDAAESIQKPKVTTDQDQSAETLDDQDAYNRVGRVREFRDMFSKLLSDSKVDRLIVLVDDLDRCAPERLVDNLEAIKLFLNLENTAFVIAADERIVRQAIALRYHTDAYDNESASNADASIVTDYLEKLIQIPYRIPRLSPDESLTYMNLLYCEKHLKDEDLQKYIGIHAKQQIENRYAPLTKKMILDEKPDQQQCLAEDLGICEAIAPVVTETLKGNPRQIKRFLNAFELRLELAKKSHIPDIRRDVLAKLMVLEYSHPIKYRQLYDWQEASDGYPKQLRAMESGEFDDSGVSSNEEKDLLKQWKEPGLTKWVQLVPSLSDVDLRSYFWLTRDTPDAPLFSTNTISPLLEKLIKDLLSDSDPRRNAAQKSAQGLGTSDANILASALASSIARNPKKIRGYEALSSLALYSELYLRQLVEAVKAVGAKDLPPAVVLDLSNIRRDSDTSMAESIRGVISELARHPDTPAGRAAATLAKKE